MPDNRSEATLPPFHPATGPLTQPDPKPGAIPAITELFRKVWRKYRPEYLRLKQSDPKLDPLAKFASSDFRITRIFRPREEKYGHRAMVCGGIEIPMNDDKPAPKGALAEEPYVFDGPQPLGCGDDHRVLVGPTGVAGSRGPGLCPIGVVGTAVPPGVTCVSTAAPVVEKITESHRQLKLACHKHLRLLEQSLPINEWRATSGVREIAKLIDYTPLQ